MRARVRRISLPGVLLFGTAGLFGQDTPRPAPPPAAQTPTFPAQVDQVVVDLVVTDNKGRPITGLTKNDMIVLEDGVPQTIVSFDAVELPAQPGAAPPPPPPVSTNTGLTEQRGRTFVIVFDDVHMTPYRARDAKASVASFLEKGVREGDRVSLISTAGGTWWTARMERGRQQLLDIVKRFDGRYIPDMSPERMSDYEAMRIHVYRDPQVAARVLRRYETYGVTYNQMSRSESRDALAGTPDDPFVTGRASEVYFQATTRNRITLELLERALKSLEGIKGRKSLVLVSEGFIYDPNLDEYKRVNEAARRANTAMYFVNARGLEGLPVEFTAQFGPALPEQDVGFAFADALEAVAGSETLAEDSGGFVVRNTNDLSKGIQRIANETLSYYLLGYNPSNTARDGKFRKIQVKLAKGKGLEVRARRGYYAPSDEAKTALSSKPGVDPVLQAALDSPFAVDGLPLRMTHYVGEEKMLGKASVLIATEVDVKALSFEEKEGRQAAEIDFLLVTVHGETGEFFRYDQKVNMRLLPATRERLGRQWFGIVRDFELAPGGYQAKMVVREPRTGRVGTVMHDFTVPPLDQFRIATPILSDTRQPGEEGPVPRLAVLARRDFPQGADLLCQIEVYGAAKDAKTGMPQVLHGYEVRRSDGVLFTRADPSAIRPTSLGQLNRLFGFSLRDAEPGSYELVMNLRDEISGKTIEERESFVVGPPLPETATARGSGSAGTP